MGPSGYSVRVPIRIINFYPQGLSFMYPGRLLFNGLTAKLLNIGAVFQTKGSPMLILIVSANPLFKEVINEAITQVQFEIMELNYGEARNRICEIRPDVMIIDDTIAAPYFESLLAEARNLKKTRIIVLNPQQNEIVLLDSRRTTLRKVDDLMEAISNSEFDLRSEIDERKPPTGLPGSP